MANKNIVFDIVGTLACYDKLFDTIEQRLGDRLRERGVQVEAFCQLWIEVAEREYTYLSISGRYVEYRDVFEAMLERILFKCGIQERGFATGEDLAVISKAYGGMELRPGAAPCIEKLRKADFTVWGLTMANLDSVSSYFKRAGITMPSENLLSCDSTGIGKPEPGAYRPLYERLSQDGGKPWFAAAHQWDTSAAGRVGFRSAYCTILEGQALDIFGQSEVVADQLEDMADQVIAASQ